MKREKRKIVLTLYSYSLKKNSLFNILWNGHFYHIKVTDLPFHTIPFVSCFISLIDNTKKMNFHWKFTSKFEIIFVLQSLLGSLFLALCTTLALIARPRAVRADKDNGRRLSSQDYASIRARTMTMEDAYQVKITLQFARTQWRF